MSFEEIKPNSDNKESTTWDPQPNGTLEGFYKGFKVDIGPHKSRIYSIETNEGLVGVWGSASMNMCMEQVREGDKIKILFEGVKNNPNTGRDYKSFKVYKDSDTSHDASDVV